MNQNQLKKTLQTLPVADDLEAKLNANWQQQLDNNQRQKPLYAGRLLAVAASVVLTLLILVFYHSSPLQIERAYADILKDAAMTRSFSAPQRQWFKQNNLAAIPKNMQLELVKDCHLGEQTHLHLRIAGEHRGKVNLFIRKAVNGGHNDAGELKGFRWHRFNLENDMQVLVLYDKNMRKQGVNHLLKTVFADYSAMHV